MTHTKDTSPTCVLDQTVINADTVSDLQDMGLSFFATLCGRNRGAFVLNPTDRHTWGCTALPPQFAKLAGVEKDVPLADANAIKTQFQGGNLTASETIDLLDLFVKSVYFSTPNKETDPFACELGGLARLQCDPVNTIPTVRSVTLAGLFTEALWATGGKPLSLKQARHFYAAEDFREMRKLGINTVQIPFPVMAFDHDNGDQQLLDMLADVLEWADDAHLQAILVLEGADNDNAVAAAAHFCADRSNVFALTLPSEQSLRAARAAEAQLKLLIPITMNTIKEMHTFPDENVFGALSMDHTIAVADIASSTSVDDRMKLFYHEALACIGRSPLEYATCFQHVPVFVASGVDLAVDNCAMQDSTSIFVDYGQCDRFNETIDSDWWHRHRKSFLARQLFSYEHGLGWSFAAWKLYGDDDTNVGVLDSWAKLMSFKDVAAAKLVPSFGDGLGACLNPPVADFTLGDATLAPTPGPPPDCGNGWWNASINDCSYWIPPAPTPVPTRAPVTASPTLPCPACPSCLNTTTSTDMSLNAGIAGFLAGVVLMALYNCIASRRRGNGGYSEIPTLNV